ncbi:MAG TPA: PAS domain S-box protein [Coleofasciculaceae cyanobacterium]
MMKESRTILIVEDCLEDRQLLCRYLQRDDRYAYTILEAETGEDGLEKYRIAQPDAILLDYLLPGMNGLEFLQSLQQQIEKIDLPVVVLTGQESANLNTQVIHQGAQQYLNKSTLTAENLRLALHSAIKQGDLLRKVAALQTQTQQTLGALSQQFEQQRLVMEVTHRIRQSLNLQDILQTTVNEVRQFLQTDRVIIFQFLPNGYDTTVVESVGTGWTAILSDQSYQPSLGEPLIESPEQGLITAVSDIYTADINPNQLERLASFQVRAKLSIPILKGDQVWGMLIAHHCAAPRQWQSAEIDLLRQIAAHVSIAIQQSDLFAQVQTELTERQQAEAERQQAEKKLRQAKEELERRVAERTAELTEVNDRLLAALIEQQHTQLILQEQAQLLELAHNTIMTRNLKEVITFWNEGAESLYGWTKAEAVGQQTHALLQTQFPKPYAEIQAELLEQGYWEGELIHTCRDGSTITVDSRWVMQKDELGRPIKVLEISSDISDRKQAEAVLQESERRWRSLFESSNLAVISIDPAGTLTAANPFFLNLMGYTEDDIINKNWFDLFISSDRAQKQLRQFQENLQQELCPTGQSQLLTRSGEDKVIRWSNTLLRNPQGEVIGVTGIGEDVTQRQAVEKLKEEFISIVSHELRTPLTSIRGSLGLLATGMLDDDPSTMKRMIEIASIDTERLVRLVNDILDLEKLKTGKISLVREWCDVADLIRRSIEVMESRSQESGVQLIMQAPSIQIWVAADRIIQTFTNLLSNAIKFSPTGGSVWVKAEVKDHLDQPKNDISASAPSSPHSSTLSSHILFSIKDQGRGIPPDKLENIFDRFQQVDASDSRDHGGSGLGLAICRSIVQEHNGQIWAESVKGQGSTFFFTLPLSIK